MREDTAPAIAVLPYGRWRGTGPAELGLDELLWPLGRPERLQAGRVSDMGPSDHLITFPRFPVFWAPWRGIRANVSVMIVEPDSIHGKHLFNARLTYRRFYRVLSRNRRLLDNIPNGILHYPGATMIDAPATVDRRKSRMCSLIASAKRDLIGHQLRHQIVDHIRGNGLDVDIMGRGYLPFDKKEDGLAPYRYSVVIENSAEPGYFTEKLIDAMLCDTVPIYWGAPDIAEHFDPDGMIICSDAEEIKRALANLSHEDYDRRKAAIEQNRSRAAYFADDLTRAARAVLDS